jgi:O-antigen/teichoic acid export membrane protein
MIKSFSFYSFGEIFSRLGKILFLFILAIIQSKSDYGMFNYLFSIVGLFVVFFDCGLSTYMVVRAKPKNIEYLFNVFLHAKITVISLVFLSTIFLIKFNYIFNKINFVYSLYIIGLAILWDLSVFIGSALRSRFDFFGDSVIKILSSFIPFLFLIIFSYKKSTIGIEEALLSQILGFLVADLWGLNRANSSHRIQKISARLKTKIIPLIFMGFMISIAASGAVLLSSIDALILGYFSKLEFLASFSIANKIALMAYIPLGIIIGYLMPFFVKYYRGDRQFDITFLNNIFIASIFAGLFLTQIYIFGIDFIAANILHAKYQDLITFSSAMSFMILPNFIHPVFWAILASKRSTLAVQMPPAITTLIIIIYDIVSITHFNENYVKWSPFIANSFILLIFILFFRYKYKYLPFNKKTFIYFFASLFASFFLYFFRANEILVYFLRFILVVISVGGVFIYGNKCFIYFRKNLYV